MAIFLNPDNANFNEAVHSKIYVDKTGLIEYTNSVLSTTAKFVCNSRPRRFWKIHDCRYALCLLFKGM